MISMDSNRLVDALHGEKRFDAPFDFTGVEIDSRRDCSGRLFVAIKGDNFDGHDYVASAANKGAVAAIVEHELDLPLPQVIVEDSRKALGLLANAWRNLTAAKVIAITGSNGKTTVKEMLGRILSSRHKIIQTAGNLNNDIGVPLTLFRLSEDDEFAVIEMGANHGAEIKELVAIADPDIVYVNNARAAHVEGFGSVDAIIKAKGEMYQYCRNDSLAVFNQDEKALAYWQSVCNTTSSLSFSLQNKADVTASYEKIDKGLRVIFNSIQHQASTEINVQGIHNVQNASAAVTLAIACGLSLQQAAESLRGFGGVTGRQEFKRGANGCLIIDDSYNANPDSLAVAVEVLCSLDGEAWLALGDMAELGKDSPKLHHQAIKNARDAGVEQFFALGKESCASIDVFSENGFCFENHSDMATFLSARLSADVNLLVKGSRSAGMEKLVDSLTTEHYSNAVNGGQHAV